MNAYQTYLRLWKDGTICAGFSPRFPDYASRHWFDSFQQAIPDGLGTAFLDVGAGDGRLSLVLLHNYSVSGLAVDVWVNHMAWDSIVKRYGRFELKEGFLQEVLKDLQDKRQFNFIVLAEVFEHVPPADVPALLSNLHGLLAPGGKIFLTTPNRVVQGPAEKSHMWHEKTPYGHYKHYTVQEITELLRAAGLDVAWQTFECHKAKKMLYNKWLYPLSRLDARLMNSAKIPKPFRFVYKVVSLPVVAVLRGWFWLLAKGIYVIEKRYSNEKTGATIILAAEKAGK